MKILRLKFSNIHSLKGEHEIDFTISPLAETGIFAIVGPTGSGKTTILDVITLALYGKISRLGNKLTAPMISKDGAVVTRGQKDAYAEITYEVDGKIYQSLWKFHREKKMYFFVDGQAVADKDVPERNAEVIGLTYDQFIRAVVLPQGEFANFLKADSDQKIQILEKITGGEVFRDLGRLAFNIAKEKENQLAVKKAERDAISLLDETEIKDIENQIKNYSIQLKSIGKELDTLEAKRKVKQQIADIKAELENYIKQLKGVDLQWNGLKSDFDLLDKHEKFSQYKDKIKEYSIKKEEMQRLERDIEKLNKDIDELNAYVDELKQRLQVKKQQQQKSDDKIKFYEPVVKQVRQLDTEIQKLISLIKEKNSQIKDYRKKILNKKQELEQLELKIKDFTKKQADLDKWLKDNILLLDLKEEITSLEETLKQSAAVFKRLQDNVERAGMDVDVRNLDKLQRDLEMGISQLKQELNKDREVLDGISEEELKSRGEKLKEKADLLKDLAVKLEALDEMHKEIEKLNKDLEDVQEKEAEFMDQKIKLEKLLDELHNEEKQLAAQADKQKELEIFSRMREQLEEGKPCPVCGSVHHPYVEDKVEIHLEDFKQKLEEIQRKIENVNEEKSRLQAQLSKLEGIKQEIMRQHKDLTDKATAARGIIKEITDRLNISEDLNTEAVKLLIDQVNKDIKENDRKISIFNRYSSMESKLNVLENLYQDLIDLLDLRNTLTKRVEVYKAYYPEKAKVAEALKTLRSRLADYEKAEKYKIETDKNLEVLKSNRKSLSDLINDLKKSMQIIENELKQAEGELHKLQNKRSELFSGDDINAFWDSLWEEKRTIDEELGKLNQELEKKLVSIAEKQKQLKDKQDLFNTVSEYVSKTRTDLLPVLQRLDNSLQDIDDAWKNILDEMRSRQIRQKKETLSAMRIKLNSAIKERQEKLNELIEKDNTDISMEQLEQMINQLSARRDEINQNLGQLRQKLEQNEKNKVHYENLSAEIEKLNQEYQRWQRLENLIGNADGSKFQRIAQEYSFLVLLDAANEYLTRFTDRYSLIYEKSGGKKLKYDFYVEDNYMGGMRREVSTLSGGESFLVSLSLALGLSALASRKVKIENIFIDEGFGSLDSNTLDQALSVLDRFHSQSKRKIGIISHVEALKERIPVKIQLIRQGQGFSRIEIMSG